MTIETAYSPVVRGEPSTYPDWFKTGSAARPLIVSRWVPILLVGLPVLVLFAIVVYPTIWMWYHSFRDTNINGLFSGNHQFIGLGNYITVLKSSRFQASLAIPFHLRREGPPEANLFNGAQQFCEPLHAHRRFLAKPGI